ncbi:MAG: dihydropteroate synthase [Deltaproteobacteria bacterium]|nr:MAG: dihydropteroate synthase [Deltaproteobacteria bacterium]
MDRYVLHCRKSTLFLRERTHIMGILNVTPDSFSDGGRFLRPEAAIGRALEMIEEGADLLDIGGESTRPGAQPVDTATEIARVVPVVEAIAARTEVPISIDTTKAEVARRALEAGADIINDISAARFDPQIVEVAARFEAPMVLMHIRGTPQTMQNDLHYDDVVAEIEGYLRERIATLRGRGLSRFILDPGIGFGKGLEHNLILLRRLSVLLPLGYPILVGVSRKSFIGALTGVSRPADRLAGTIAAQTAAILNGAAIVRAHDVKAAVEAARVADALKEAAICAADPPQEH